MQGSSIGVIEPITRVKGQQFDLRAFRQVGRLVHHKPASMDQGLNRHTGSLALDAPPNKRLHPTTAASSVSRVESTTSGRRG